MNFKIENIEFEKMIDIIIYHFPPTLKLYNISIEEIQKFEGLYDIDIIKIFNNRDWLDILNDYNYLEISGFLEFDFPSLYGVMKFVDKNNIYSYEMFILKFITRFTGVILFRCYFRFTRCGICKHYLDIFRSW